jgi:hypothetical protein
MGNSIISIINISLNVLRTDLIISTHRGDEILSVLIQISPKRTGAFQCPSSGVLVLYSICENMVLFAGHLVIRVIQIILIRHKIRYSLLNVSIHDGRIEAFNICSKATPPNLLGPSH